MAKSRSKKNPDISPRSQKQTSRQTNSRGSKLNTNSNMANVQEQRTSGMNKGSRMMTRTRSGSYSNERKGRKQSRSQRRLRGQERSSSKKGRSSTSKNKRRGEKAIEENFSPKRKRQYEHIFESELKQGRDEKSAKRIAAATVNKQRAQSGETKK